MKGQAFTVFKMLIGAAFAAILLAVVYQAVNNIGCPTYCVDEIKSLAVQASNMPGQCFEKQVCFDKGAVLDEAYFEKALNLDSFTIKHNHISSLDCSSGKCEFGFKATIPVTMKCSSGSCVLDLGSKCN